VVQIIRLVPGSEDGSRPIAVVQAICCEWATGPRSGQWSGSLVGGLRNLDRFDVRPGTGHGEERRRVRVRADVEIEQAVHEVLQ
jgi:hypothetical protein